MPADSNVNANVVPNADTTTQTTTTTPQGTPDGNRADTSRGTEQPKGFTYAEDRSKWIPDHRLREVSSKAEAAAKRATELEAALSERDRKIQALAGITPQDPNAVDEAGLRASILKLLPELAPYLEAGRGEKVAKMLSQMEGFQETQNRYWGGIADTMLEGVKGELAKSLGGELSARQAAKIERAYRLEAEAAMQAREANPDADYSNDFLARHTRGDKTLITEFVKEFADDFFEPARRQATAAAVRRTGRPVPNGRSGEPVVTQKAKVDYGDEDKFKDALLESLQRHTGN